MPENFDVMLIWSVIFAVVVTAIVVILILRKYKKKLKSPIYPVDKYACLSLARVEDRFLDRTVTRVRVSSSSNRKR
jgi:hypothetical protein